MTTEYVSDIKVYFALKKTYFNKSKMAAGSHIGFKHKSALGFELREYISVTHDNGVIRGL